MKTDELCINTLRFLSIEAVEKAKSGHPGAPMGMAAMAYALWQHHLKHNPSNPEWFNRDRFVLSAGHASALLYSLLLVYGYPLPLDELKRFRQLGSMTPGHPEHDVHLGIETTTGPLGQGFGNAVGMAMAEAWLAATFNRPGYEIVDHFTYVFASDGDMMEGVTSEAASLAGTLALGKLICIYDDNEISIEGSTTLAFTENVAERFRSYGWHVLEGVDGLDHKQVEKALDCAKTQTDKPSLILCSTTIGYGSPGKAGKASAHGEPLGTEEVRLVRQTLDWPYAPFEIPEAARHHFNQVKHRGQKTEDDWMQLIQQYRSTFPELATVLDHAVEGKLPEDWESFIGELFGSVGQAAATREHSGVVLNAFGGSIENLLGGSADLAPSNKTLMKNSSSFNADNYAGRNLHFGVREHAMASLANGMSLHGGVIPYIGTFLIFYDYMRPAVRLAAMMGVQVIYVFTHDSIGLGEDGPTHQPVEQLMGLRMVPGMVTLRPADGIETLQAWQIAIERKHGPTALVLTRQKVPAIDRSNIDLQGDTHRGAYIIWQASDNPEFIIIATGSEVSMAIGAARILAERGIKSRVVSMPSWELFEAQDKNYRERVLPSAVSARISVEAGRTLGWQKYVGNCGIALGVDTFGASAPWIQVYEHVGLSADAVVKSALTLLANNQD